VQFVGQVTVGPLANGNLIHATARVSDVTGAAARAGVDHDGQRRLSVGTLRGNPERGGPAGRRHGRATA